MGMTGRHGQAEPLGVIQVEFPHFRIWREFTGSRMRYTAQRISPGQGLHTVITGDLGELRAALSAACPPPGPPSCERPAAASGPEWGIGHREGIWTPGGQR